MRALEECAAGWANLEHRKKNGTCRGVKKPLSLLWKVRKEPRLKISITFGFRQKWQPHSERGLKKIEVYLSGYKTTPLCSWLVQCSQPQGHSGTPLFPWFGSSVQGLRGQHSCVRPWDGRGEKNKGQYARTDCLPRMLPPLKPSQKVPPHKSWARA